MIRLLAALAILLMPLTAQAHVETRPIEVGYAANINWNCKDLGAVEEIAEFFLDGNSDDGIALILGYTKQPSLDGRPHRCFAANFRYWVKIERILRVVNDTRSRPDDPHRMYIVSYKTKASGGREFFTIMRGESIPPQEKA